MFGCAACCGLSVVAASSNSPDALLALQRGFSTEDAGPVELFITHLKFKNASGRNVTLERNVSIAVLVKTEDDAIQLASSSGRDSPTSPTSPARTLSRSRSTLPEGWQCVHRRNACPRADGAFYTPITERAQWPEGVDRRRAHALDAMALPTNMVGSVGRVVFALISTSDGTQHVLGSVDFRLSDLLANNAKRTRVIHFHVPLGQSGGAAMWTPASMATGEATLSVTPTTISRASKGKQRYVARRAEKDLQVFRRADETVNLTATGELRAQRSDDYMRNFLPLTFAILRDLHVSGMSSKQGDGDDGVKSSSAPSPAEDGTKMARTGSAPALSSRNSLPGASPSRQTPTRSASSGRLLLARSAVAGGSGGDITPESPSTSTRSLSQLDVHIPENGLEEDHGNAALEAASPQARTPLARSISAGPGPSPLGLSRQAQQSAATQREEAVSLPHGPGLDMALLDTQQPLSPARTMDRRSSSMFVRQHRPSFSTGRRGFAQAQARKSRLSREDASDEAP